MANKKEFAIAFHKDVNSAWSGSAYFVNDILGKRLVVGVSAGPNETKTISVSWIKQRLTEYEEEMRSRHYGWYRVNKEEYDNFKAKN